jgi:outer membrane protein OmpA-like peptidoglycan-associated protein
VTTPPEQTVVACQTELSRTLAESTIKFDLGSAALPSEAAPAMRKLAAIAATCDGLQLRIEGHTDDSGEPNANRALSQRRAEAVREGLTTLGVDAARMTAVGRGASEPVADNTTLEGRRANRRIEITVAQ